MGGGLFCKSNLWLVIDSHLTLNDNFDKAYK